MPKTQKKKAGKGVPRKAGNQHRQAKYADYRARSTCWCGSVFRSPPKKAAHSLEKHPQLN
jgi:hypothetical protein